MYGVRRGYVSRTFWRMARWTEDFTFVLADGVRLEKCQRGCGRDGGRGRMYSFLNMVRNFHAFSTLPDLDKGNDVSYYT